MAGERTVKVRFDGDATGVKKAGEDGEKAVGKWSKSVDAASVAVGAAAARAGEALVGMLSDSVGQALEQSQIKAQLAASLNSSAPVAQQAGEAAGDLFSRGVVGSFDEAAAAVRATLQNNLVPANAGKKELDAVAARVSNLATLMGEDATSVGRAISQMVRTGIADSSEQAFDILARGTQLGINKSEDLLDTFNEYGTQFRKLGIDGPQALGLLNQAIKGGARDADLAADAIKEFSIRAVDGSTTTAQGFKALGLNAGQMSAAIAAGGDKANAAFDTTIDKLSAIQDPLKRSQIATKLFGTQAEDLGDALFKLDPSTAAKGLDGLAGSADKAGKTMEQSAGARVQAFQRMLQEKLVNTLGEVVGWMDRNQELVKTLATVLGPIAGIITAIVVAVKIWTVAQAALDVVLNANPIGLIVAGVALLVAGIVLIATKTKFFQTIWGATWGFIKDVAAAVGNWFMNTLWPLIKAVFDFIVAYVKFVLSVWKAVFNAIVTVIKFFYNSWLTYVNLIVTVIKKINAAVTAVYNYVVDKFNSVVRFIAGVGSRIAAGAKGMWDGIKNSFKSAINWIIDKWNNLSFSLPTVNTPFGSIGGFTLNTPNIGRLASGGWAQGGRTYLTGENGPELITMGRGSSAYVNSADNTAAMTGNAVPVVHVYIGDRELTDMIDVQVESSDRQKRRRASSRVAGGVSA